MGEMNKSKIPQFFLDKSTTTGDEIRQCDTGIDQTETVALERPKPLSILILKIIVILFLAGGVIEVSIKVYPRIKANLPSFSSASEPHPERPDQALQTIQTVVGEENARHAYILLKQRYNSLESQQTTIGTYEEKIHQLEEKYPGKPQTSYSSSDQLQWQIWQTKITSLKAIYNQKASEYNATYNTLAKLPGLKNRYDIPLPEQIKTYVIEK